MKYRMKHAPMGWNSYDYYDTTVTEREVRANADYMAAHLKPYGWEYIVVDIQWYAKTVSYTHLRAHETGRNLVCRLLLEKKKQTIKKKKSYYIKQKKTIH